MTSSYHVIIGLPERGSTTPTLRPLAENAGRMGDPKIAAVGLLGKLLGPVGMFWQIRTGAWPVSALVLCVTNDFIWWIPFGMYLYDAWPAFRQDA